ncbi:MAG: polyamine ABC transporter substrate-binding protein [Gemmobacter sp.]
MTLTRRTALVAAGGALALPWVRPSWAQARRVNVYNWTDYIGETTIADFERETGIAVTYDLYASAEEMQAKMLVGQTGYDVVLQAGVSMPRMVAAGVFQKLDRARLTGWENLDPDILRILEGFDPGIAYSVPYMWGSVGFAYNVTMVRERLPDADLESLDTIFLPENAAKLADCGISILDSPDDIMASVLKWLGLDPDTAGAAEYKLAADAFAEIRQYIAVFDNSNFLSGLPNGELCVANSWSGDYRTAKSRAAEAGIDIDLAYYVPRTGAPTWFDVWCMPADARNVDPAYEFINYLLRPEVIAACTDYTGYGNANKAATALVDPDIANDPAVYPDDAVLARMYTPKTPTEEQEREMLRAWQMVKSGG